MDITEEKQLYEPVKSHFQGLGFKVHGEVKGFDLVGSKDEELLIVELKKQFSTKLLTQGIKAQRLTSNVYLAIPKPRIFKMRGKWKDQIMLLRRLELGLLFVSQKGESYIVEEVTSPKPYKPRHTKALQRKINQVHKEVAERHGDYNIGGSTGVPLVTAYREKAVHIACILENHEFLSTKDIRKYGAEDKSTTKILYNNHYGWFERVDRGVYSLTTKGKESLNDFQQLADYYRECMKEKDDDRGNL